MTQPLTNRIISQDVNSKPDFNSCASKSSTGVLQTDSPTWTDLIRAERTAGGPAVSQGIRDGGTAMAVVSLPPSPSIPAPCQTNALPSTGQTVQKTTLIVGFSKLRSLLWPVHKFFEDKLGKIKEFRLYSDKERDLAYPEVEARHRDNPYRRHQLVHKASARTFKKLKCFVERHGLDDFMVASLVLTMPKFMSEYLAGCGFNGRGLAWRLFDGFWNEDLPDVVNRDIGLGCRVNLHLWRTEVPIKPHYHFHCLIPNYSLKIVFKDGESVVPQVPLSVERLTSNVSCRKCGGNEFWCVPTDESRNWHCCNCYPVPVERKKKKVKLPVDYQVENIKRWEWHRQRGGKLVPFSDEQLEKLKELWRDRLARFCKRHSLEFIEGKIDIYVEYIDVWAKLLHRFNYNGRHWSENYAEYSNDNPDCPEPPSWLSHYENKARVKGWWSNMKNIEPESEGEIVKLSPYTGEPMEYISRGGLEWLINRVDTRLGFVEFVKGKPVEGILSDNELNWLKEVMAYKAYLSGIET